ncbi:MAG: glycosyltransferase family 2 protein [Patescibacteria group bacterium]
MIKKISELSVFFPTYNEEKNIKKVVLDAKKVLQKLAGKWEIIIVNDGSYDKTRGVAEKLAKNDKRIGVVNHKVNLGYGSALKSGFKAAKYSWVAFTDSDGQFKFSEIDKFLENMDKADLILGYRLNRADSFLRTVYTYVWGSIPVLLWGLNVRDYSCGFKLIKKKVFNSIQPLVGEEKVTQIEMLVKAKRAGFRFAEVGVQHYPREYGKQTGANVKVVAKSIMDLVSLWQKLH